MNKSAGSACLIGLFLLTAACGKKQPDIVEVSPADADRRDLVLQPMAPEAPGSVPLKLSINLISEKSSIRKTEKFGYRLEMKNVGRDPIRFAEAPPSFIKDGSLCGSGGYRFLVTPPGGKEEAVPCARSAGSTPLDLTLAPGEYLLSKPGSPESRFRDLDYRFSTGLYRLRLVYESGGLRAESNPVDLKVVR